MTLAEVQEIIRAQYFEQDSARGAAGTFMWFIEEVGELATALHGEDRENLEEELADVLAWLTTLANIKGVDLTAAFRRKYVEHGAPPGVK